MDGSEETHAHRAYRRVVEEKEDVSDMLDGFDRFRKVVSETATDTSARGAVSRRLRGGASCVGSSGACERVLGAFDETVRGVVEPEEPLLRTVAEELGEDIAYSLSSETDAGFGEGVKSAVLSAADERRSELRAMRSALSAEERSLSRSVAAVEETVGSEVLEEDESKLLSLGFGELRDRYDTVSRMEERCEESIEERQELLHKTTKNGVEAGLRHHDLVGYLYEDMPTEYPALSTLTRAKAVCAERRRLLREHLSRTG